MTSSKIFKDGSSGKMCTEALKKYCENDDKAELHIMPYNMGHGLALHYGIIEVNGMLCYYNKQKKKTNAQALPAGFEIHDGIELEKPNNPPVIIHVM